MKTSKVDKTQNRLESEEDFSVIDDYRRVIELFINLLGIQQLVNTGNMQDSSSCFRTHYEECEGVENSILRQVENILNESILDLGNRKISNLMYCCHQMKLITNQKQSCPPE